MDAMPACWLNLSVEERHNVLAIIKGMYENAAPDQPVSWKKHDVVRLSKYVSLEDVHKLRACYLTAQKDPSVIVGTDPIREIEEVVEQDQTIKNIDDFFNWRPESLMQEYRRDRTNVDCQKKFFTHMTNHAAQMTWNSTSSVGPSSYLDVEITDDQKELLCPSYKNVLMGYILYDVKGKGAKRKLAKRRLDVISGNVASYAKCLNDPKRLKQIQEVNQITATVAEVTADMDKAKLDQKNKALDKKKASKEKKEAKAAAVQEKRAQELPTLRLLMHDFETGRRDITVLSTKAFPKPCLLKMPQHCYDARPVGAQSMAKGDLHDEIIKCFNAKKEATNAA